MPRVQVITDDAKREILLDELVNPEHLGSGHSAEQLVERLAWSIEDATRAEAHGRTDSHSRPRSAKASEIGEAEGPVEVDDEPHSR